MNGAVAEDTPFDRVIPHLTVFFWQHTYLEEAAQAALFDDLEDTPFSVLIEEAVDSGHLLPGQIYSAVRDFFREELSEVAWRELRQVDRAFLQAAALGNGECLWILGLRLVNAANGSVDLDEQEDLNQDGLFLVVEATEAGEARAQWMLGERFSRMKDGLDESVRLLGMASAQGFKFASSRLEELFDNRFAFVHTASERKWLRRFAVAGVAEAQFELANEFYLSGDAKTAFAWMLQAANASHHLAQQRLAFFYEVGEGCSRNRQRAEYWRNFGQPPESISSSTVAEPETDEVEPSPVVEQVEVPPASPATDLSDLPLEQAPEVEPIENQAQETAIAEPILTPEETALSEETIQEFALEELPVDTHDAATKGADQPKFIVQPTLPRETGSGLASRFRRGLAGVLRRLADKIGNSPPADPGSP